MKSKMLSLFGLKWNPFSPNIPTHALHITSRVESFCWRIETQVTEGGFAQILGDPGTGKSVVLRILSDRLRSLRDVTVAVLTRPQAKLHDFYRELGHLFSVPLSPHNRWQGSKALRQRWLTHIESAHIRPVLLVDEAQEMLTSVLCELRLLQSANLDSQSILTVVLCGDARLRDKLQLPELLPVDSRIRTRLRAEPASPQELHNLLDHLLAQAGNAQLMTPELKHAVCEHAAGNSRLMCNLGNELLLAGAQREVDQLDEALFFDVFQTPAPARKGRRRKRA
jgi:general secretion pathway protein A